VVAAFSFPRERIVHPLIVTAMIAFLTTSCARSVQSRSSPRGVGLAVQRIAAIIAALGLLAACYMGATRLRAEPHMQKAIIAQGTGDWQTLRSEAEEALSWAVQIDPTTNPLRWYQGISYMAEGELDSALAKMQEGYTANPNHIQLLNNLAYCYHALGQLDSAKTYYLKAAEISPLQETLLNLAILYYDSGRPDSAALWLDRLPNDATDDRIPILRQRLRETDSNPAMVEPPTKP